MIKLNYNFEDKVVLVTGSSAGLGYEVAKSYLKSGANLIICSKNYNCLNDVATTDKQLVKKLFGLRWV